MVFHFNGFAELEQELTLSDEQVRKLQTENKSKRSSSLETVLIYRNGFDMPPSAKVVLYKRLK